MFANQQIQFFDQIKLKGLILGSTFCLNMDSYSITCSISKQMLHSPSTIFYPSSICYTDTSVELSQFKTLQQTDERVIKDQELFCFHIQNENTQPMQRNILFQSYHCSYNPIKGSLHLQLQQAKPIRLKLSNVQKPRFVKSKHLDKLLYTDTEEHFGILTMDQSGRFMVEPNNSKFPAVGLWIKCDNIHDVKVYSRICQFLRKIPSNTFQKLKIVMKGESYICFSKITKDVLPELFMVSWSDEGTHCWIQRQFDMRTNSNVTLEMGQQNLQFTLNGKKQTKSITNSSVNFSSPMKIMTNFELQDQLQKIHLQNSPEFSSIKKQKQWSNWSEERTLLYQKVENQEEEICKLKQMINSLNKQIAKMRKCVTSPPQKNLLSLNSPFLIPDSSTPAHKSKKLSESDLQSSNLKSFGTNSTREKKSFGEDSNGSQHKKQGSLEQDPWDIMQIIE